MVVRLAQLGVKSCLVRLLNWIIILFLSWWDCTAMKEIIYRLIWWLEEVASTWLEWRLLDQNCRSVPEFSIIVWSMNWGVYCRLESYAPTPRSWQIQPFTTQRHRECGWHVSWPPDGRRFHVWVPASREYGFPLQSFATTLEEQQNITHCIQGIVFLWVFILASKTKDVPRLVWRTYK